MATAIITGITGQDGSYLAELLLEKGYKVVGFVRRSSSQNFLRIEHILDRITIEYGDLTDIPSIALVVHKHQPDEFYNLAAQSFVQTSFDQPVLTANITGLGALNCLEAIRLNGLEKKTRFYQAGSSEMFGKVREIPQNELTPFYPRSPYGVSKIFAHWTSVNYRESYNMFVCNGILFNHCSPRRGIEFVTQKISVGAANIAKGKQLELRLGNLDAKRDISHAKDMVYGMWLMLQQDEPDDYVLSSNETHSIREICDLNFKYHGLNYEDYVVIDPKFYRPAEVDILLGDSTKARTKLGWKPEYSFEDLIYNMAGNAKFSMSQY